MSVLSNNIGVLIKKTECLPDRRHSGVGSKG